MISTQLKVVFVDIPKTGSTSLKRFLIRSFYPYYFNTVTDPLWMLSVCPKGNTATYINKDSSVVAVGGNRHEPILSIYKNTHSYLHDCFIFSSVRNPFSRFKSFVLEQMLFNYYGLPIRSLQNFQKASQDQYLIDPGNLFTHKHVFKRSTGWDENKVMLNFLHITLNRIKNKGGFRNYNACDIDLHLWPQYMFFNLPSPQPLPIHLMSFENIETDFEMLKKDLSSFTGLNVNNIPLPQADPIPEMIYLRINPYSKDEIKELLEINYEQEWESTQQFIPLLPFHEEILKNCPTYSSFIVEYKKVKEQLADYLFPILESDFRELIEDIYDEDYRLLGYKKDK